MEWLATILTSDNAVKVIIGLIVLIILLAFLAKKGIVSFKGKGLKVGDDETTRTIVRQQIEYCKTSVENFINELETTDEWKIKYMGELIYDIYVEAISYNHITKDDFYIENKVEKVWSVILKYADTDEMKNDVFKSTIEKEVRHVIEKLVDIKEYYSKEENQ